MKKTFAPPPPSTPPFYEYISLIQIDVEHNLFVVYNILYKVYYQHVMLKNVRKKKAYFFAYFKPKFSDIKYLIILHNCTRSGQFFSIKTKIVLNLSILFFTFFKYCKHRLPIKGISPRCMTNSSLVTLFWKVLSGVLVRGRALQAIIHQS